MADAFRANPGQMLHVFIEIPLTRHNFKTNM